MLFRVNFFPLQYILALILLVSFAVIFNEVLYVYLSSNFIINGAICVLFIFCTMWILGSLSYYSRSAKVFAKLLRNIGPVENNKTRKSMVLKAASPISGTLFDTPIVAALISKLERKNKLEVSRYDAQEIAQTVVYNASRILAPSRFIASIFIMLGLTGTFLGLLDTIGGVAKSLNSLATGGLGGNISAFIKMLSAPLQGMSTAFSASLFGLSAALFSNFGNYLAWERLLSFVGKMRNYLLSNTGVFDEDPARVTVRDILVSLEESFDLLYRGVVGKMSSVAKGINNVGNMVVKTHERQERMLDVILKNHEVMEEFWHRMFIDPKGINYMVELIGDRLANILPESLRKVFAPVLEAILNVMNENTMRLDRVAGISEDSLRIQQDMSKVKSDMLQLSRQQAGILDASAGILSGIQAKLNTEELASLISEGNKLKSDVAGLLQESNHLSTSLNNAAAESNNINAEVVSSINKNADLLESLIDETSRGLEVSERALVANEVGNEISIDIKAGIDDSIEAVNSVKDEVVMSNNISNAIVSAVNVTNEINNNVYNLAEKVFAEAKEIAVVVAENSDKLIVKSDSLLQVTDDRLSTIISFSRDLLGNMNDVLTGQQGVLSYLENITNLSNDGLELAAVQIEATNLIASSSKDIYEDLKITLSNTNLLIGSVNNSIVEKFDTTLNAVDVLSKLISDGNQDIVILSDTSKNLDVNISNLLKDVNNYSSIALNNSSVISESIDLISQELAGQGDIISGLATGSEVIGGTVSSIVDVISTLKDVQPQLFDSLSTAMTEAISEQTSFVSGISEALAQDYDLSLKTYQETEKLSATVDAVNAFLIGFGEEYGSRSVYITKIEEQVTSIVNMFSVFEANLSESLQSIPELKGKIDEIASGVKQSSNSLESLNVKASDMSEVSKVQEEYVSVVKEIQQIVTNVDKSIMANSGLINNVSNDVKQVVEYNQLNKGVQAEISNMAKDSLGALNNLLDNLKTIKSGVDGNSAVVEKLNNSIELLNSNSTDLKSLTNELPKVISSIHNIGEIVSSLNKSESLSEGMNSISDRIVKEFKDLTDVVQLLGEGFTREAQGMKVSSNELRQDIIKLGDDTLSLLTKVVSNEETSNTDSDISNATAIMSVSESLEGLSSKVDEIKNSLSKMISSKIADEVKGMSQTQDDMSRTLKEVLPYLERFTSSFDGVNSMSKGVNSVQTYLSEIKETEASNNMKLELLLKAIDTLISEMLNSREISQSILDMMADLGGFIKKVQA